MKRGLPLAYAGMRVGLFGGSFDPAHEGHAHVAETVLKRLRLDRVWWLVTPQNPLKPRSAPLAARLASAREQARGSRMVVTDLETRLGCAYTFETVRALASIYPGVRFTLVMGADNLISFKRWKNWREVASAVPTAVVSRPGTGPRGRLAAPPNWVFLSARHHRQSSTAIKSRRRRRVAGPGAK